MPRVDADTLLQVSDPDPVEIWNADCPTELVLVCEHAGQAIPAALGTLGVSRETRDSHRGWDIGAERVARHLSDALQAPLVIQRYSRLVIDCNRPPGGSDSIPKTSDHVDIPGNIAASAAERRLRVEEIFEPYDRAVATLLDKGGTRAAFSVHSYTPRMDGKDRPWHAGFLTRRDLETGQALFDHIAAAHPQLLLAINQPYQIDSDTDWFVPRYAEPRGLLHSLIEIRNDQIADEKGAMLWAALLRDAIRSVMEATQ